MSRLSVCPGLTIRAALAIPGSKVPANHSNQRSQEEAEDGGEPLIHAVHAVNRQQDQIHVGMYKQWNQYAMTCHDPSPLWVYLDRIWGAASVSTKDFHWHQEEYLDPSTRSHRKEMSHFIYVYI